MNRIRFIISVVVKILLSGCTQSIIPGEYLEDTIPIDSVVTCENKIKSVISQNCISCHSENNPISVIKLLNGVRGWEIIFTVDLSYSILKSYIFRILRKNKRIKVIPSL
tara:strand:- start:149 stop:475 length:327 start_codon:yes stop_codon:yes gene_type:complete